MTFCYSVKFLGRMPDGRGSTLKKTFFARHQPFFAFGCALKIKPNLIDYYQSALFSALASCRSSECGVFLLPDIAS